jgi:hypothetical protein
MKRHPPPPSPTTKTFYTPPEWIAESPGEISVISNPIIPMEVQQNPLSVLDRTMSFKSGASHSSEEEIRIMRQELVYYDYLHDSGFLAPLHYQFILRRPSHLSQVSLLNSDIINT